jgi:hypothetical protein
VGLRGLEAHRVHQLADIGDGTLGPVGEDAELAADHAECTPIFTGLGGDNVAI